MGASASLIPMQVDKDTFRRLSGGTFYDSLFDAHAIGGVITRDKLIEISKTSDYFLSHDSELDIYGRNTHERVKRMYYELKNKGLTGWFVDEQISGDVAAMCNGIDKARCIVVFITTKYVEKVQFGTITDNCQMEFNYALRRKQGDQIIPVIMEENMQNPREWPDAVRTALGNSFLIDYTDDNKFDQACDTLLQRIIKVMRSINSNSNNNNNSGGFGMNNGSNGYNNMPGGTSISNNNFDAAAREETQFSQWMARSTKINESRRIVYCAALVKLGVTSVQKLAKKMKEIKNFLPSIGVLEYDADEIALAVSDLGLGYVPVREFTGLTIDSATYALKKTVTAPEDHILASNALSCVGHIATLDCDNPLKMCELGFGDAIVKVMMNHLSDATCVQSACKTLYILASHSPEMNEYIGSCNPNPCVMIPKAMQSHLNAQDVIESSCKVIAVLSENPNNRIKLGISGICDVLMRALSKHHDNVKVCEQGILSITNLSTKHFENIGKLGSAGAVDVVSRTLALHPSSIIVAKESFKTIVLLAADPDLRTKWAEKCSTAMVEAFKYHIDNGDVCEQACSAIHTILVGNSHNRTLMGNVGACEIVRTAIEKHYNHLGSCYHGCIAIYSLSAGCPNNANKFKGLLPILHHMMQIESFANNEHLRKVVKEASFYV